MAIKVEKVVRVFVYNSVTLPDPGEKLTPDQVRDIYSASYPELANAVVEGPVTKGNEMTYKFVKAVGTKG
ncbi:MAG: carbamoylphosphate synthase large subunit [Betaproteobacteria bacterium HGW-Betaproteobacteria-18]|jgi:PRTRC genetic system protein C|nr:MAG: carbamoylphosphate synthase large subunit [Betaproteobacteria bacterium HGW-Betaproteobacteria-18]